MDVYFLVSGDVKLLPPKTSKNKKIFNCIIIFSFLYLVLIVCVVFHNGGKVTMVTMELNWRYMYFNKNVYKYKVQV